MPEFLLELKFMYKYYVKAFSSEWDVLLMNI